MRGCLQASAQQLGERAQMFAEPILAITLGNLTKVLFNHRCLDIVSWVAIMVKAIKILKYWHSWKRVCSLRELYLVTIWV